MSVAVAHVSDTDWKNVVLDSPSPVLVDFFATWCGPCKYVGPIVEQLAEELSGKVAFAKLDIDESPEVTMKYGIEGVPTLVLFKDGKEIDRVVGAAPKPALKGWLEQHV